jgi:outer membrane protein TolC
MTPPRSRARLAADTDRGRRGRAVCIGLLLAIALACAPAAPLTELASFERGAPFQQETLRARVAELDHPLLGEIEIDLGDGLGPGEAAVLAVLLDPDLAAARASRGEARAGLVAAGLLPNPSLGFETDDPYGSGSAGLSRVVNLQLSIDTRQILTHWARVAAARGEVARVDLDILWREWLTAQQARLEATRLAWLERRVSLSREQLALEEETSDRLQRAFGAGDVAAGQLGVQIAARESVRANLVGLEQARLESRDRLLALLGRPEPDEISIEPPAESSPGALPSADELLPRCLGRRLDLEALRRGYAAQDARVRQAVIEQFPDVTIGLAHQRDESQLKFFGGFVTVGVPIFDRNQAGVALAEATRERLRLEYEARATEVRGAVHDALELLELVDRRLPEVSAGVEPLSFVESEEGRAAGEGDVDWLTYETIRLALFDQRLQQASLSQLASETRIALETACGDFGWPVGSEGDTH